MLSIIKENYKLTAIDFSKQKELDADPEDNKWSFTQCKLQIWKILEKTKETVFKFNKVT